MLLQRRCRDKCKPRPQKCSKSTITCRGKEYTELCISTAKCKPSTAWGPRAATFCSFPKFPRELLGRGLLCKCLSNGRIGVACCVVYSLIRPIHERIFNRACTAGRVCGAPAVHYVGDGTCPRVGYPGIAKS